MEEEPVSVPRGKPVSVPVPVPRGKGRGKPVPVPVPPAAPAPAPASTVGKGKGKMKGKVPAEEVWPTSLHHVVCMATRSMNGHMEVCSVSIAWLFAHLPWPLQWDLVQRGHERTLNCSEINRLDSTGMHRVLQAIHRFEEALFMEVRVGVRVHAGRRLRVAFCLRVGACGWLRVGYWVAHISSCIPSDCASPPAAAATSTQQYCVHPDSQATGLGRGRASSAGVAAKPV